MIQMLIVVLKLVFLIELTSCSAVDIPTVSVWAEALSDKFGYDVNELMRVKDLQNIYDMAPKTTKWTEGPVETASAAAKLALVLKREDLCVQAIVDAVQEHESLTSLDRASTESFCHGVPYFARLEDRKIISVDNAESIASLNEDRAYDPSLTPWFAAAVAGPKDVFIVLDLEALASLSKSRHRDYIASVNATLGTLSPNDNVWVFTLDASGKFETIDETCVPANPGYTRATHDVILSLRQSLSNLDSDEAPWRSQIDIVIMSRLASKWRSAFGSVFRKIEDYRKTSLRTKGDIGGILLFTTSTLGPRKLDLAFAKSTNDGEPYLDFGRHSNLNTQEVRNKHGIPIFTYHFDVDAEASTLDYQCDSLGSVAMVPSGEAFKRGQGGDSPSHYYILLPELPTGSLEEVTSSVQFFGGAFGQAPETMIMMRPVFSKGTKTAPPSLLGVAAVDINFYSTMLDVLHLISGKIGRNSFPILTTPQGDTIYHRVILNGRGELKAKEKNDVSRYEYFRGFDEHVRRPFLDGAVGSKNLVLTRSLPKGDASSEGFDSEEIDTWYFYSPVDFWDMRLLLVFDKNDMETETIKPAAKAAAMSDRIRTSQVEDYLASDQGMGLWSNNTVKPPVLYNNGNCPNTDTGEKFGNCMPDEYCQRSLRNDDHPPGTVVGAPPCVEGSTCQCEIHRWPIGLSSRGTAVVHIAPVSLLKASDAHQLTKIFAGGKNAEQKQALTYNMTRFLNGEENSENPLDQKLSPQALMSVPFGKEIANLWIEDAQVHGKHNNTVWIYYASYTGMFYFWPANNFGFGWDATKRPWYHRARAAGSRTRTALISTPFLDSGGAGLINGLSSPIWDSQERIQGVVGYDFLYSTMNDVIPTVSDCSRVPVRNIGQNSTVGIACWLIDFSGLLLTHSDFLATEEDKERWDRAHSEVSSANGIVEEGEWPINNIFFGKKEPDIAQALIDRKIFTEQNTTDPESNNYIHYFKVNLTKFTPSQQVISGIITAQDKPMCLDISGARTSGGAVEWFITPVKHTNAFLLVVDGYKRKSSECPDKVTAKSADHLPERKRDLCLQDISHYISRSKSWQRQRSHCPRCSPGYFSNKPEIPCSACALGKFSNTYGAGKCRLCQAGTFALSPGLPACTNCHTGMYSLEIGATDYSCVPNKKCPEGADCRFSDGFREINLLPLNGYWQARKDSQKFISCARAYVGPKSKALASKRCCPNTTKGINVSDASPTTGQISSTFSVAEMKAQAYTICNVPLAMSNKSVNSQCSKGYEGNLCTICAKDYVLSGDECMKCPGGGSLGMAFIGLIIVTLVVFAAVVLLMLPCNVKRMFHEGTGDGAMLVGQFKILMTFMQLTSTMTVTFNSVPWSPRFTSVCWACSIANLDLASLLMRGPCKMFVGPTLKFIVSMLTPVFTSAAIFAAFGVMRIVSRSRIQNGDNDGITIVQIENTEKVMPTKNSNTADDSSDTGSKNWELWALCIKSLIFSVLLLYPGQVSTVFSMFRCQNIAGLGPAGTSWLQMDLNVQCWGPEHVPFLVVAVAGLLLYVIGVPLMMMFRVRKVLQRIHTAKLKRRKQILTFMYGAVFTQFENKFWYFQFFVILIKMLMTGPLVLIAPGTPVQMMVAFFVMGASVLLTLKFEPYEHDIDDVVALISQGGVCFTLLMGMLLLTEFDKETKYFDTTVVGDVLIVITVLVVIANITGMGLVLSNHTKKIKADQDLKNGKRTAVVPTDRSGEKPSPFSGPVASTSEQERQRSKRQTIKKLLNQVQRAVTQDTVERIEKSHQEHRAAHIEKTKTKGQVADARMRLRLAKRRAKNDARAAKHSNGSA